MLVKTDPVTEHQQALRDQDRKEASRAEIIAANKDATTKALNIARPDGGVDVTKLEAQVGRPMHANQIKKILKGINPRFHFEESFKDHTKVGIYIIDNRKNPLTGKEGYKRFICGMESGFMPEFTVEHVGYENRPSPDDPAVSVRVPIHKDETRGWRKVIAKLLHERLLTQQQAEKHFKISQGRSSEKWQIVSGNAL